MMKARRHVTRVTWAGFCERRLVLFEIQSGANDILSKPINLEITRKCTKAQREAAGLDSVRLGHPFQSGAADLHSSHFSPHLMRVF